MPRNVFIVTFLANCIYFSETKSLLASIIIFISLLYKPYFMIGSTGPGIKYIHLVFFIRNRFIRNWTREG